MRAQLLLWGYAVAAPLVAICTVLMRTNLWRWCEGRTNGVIPGMYSNLATLGIWLLAAVVAVVCGVGYCLSRGRSVRRMVLGAMMLVGLLSIAFGVAERGAMSAFTSGFWRWADSQNLHGVSLVAQIPTFAQGPASPLPVWWARGDESVRGTPVPAATFASRMDAPLPDESRVLQHPQGTLVMSWLGRNGGWKRYIIVGTGATPPACLDNGQVQWRVIDDGILVGVQDQH